MSAVFTFLKQKSVSCYSCDLPLPGAHLYLSSSICRTSFFYMLTSFLYQLISFTLLYLLYSRLRHSVQNATSSSSSFLWSLYASPFLNLCILQSSPLPRPSVLLPFSLPSPSHLPRVLEIPAKDCPLSPVTHHLSTNAFKLAPFLPLHSQHLHLFSRLV